MIEVGKRYKLKASHREFEVISMSKSGRHATIRMVGEAKPQDIPLATSDIESAIIQEKLAVGQQPYLPWAV